MSIVITRTPSGSYRAVAVGTDTGYGLEMRAWGKTKAEAKRNLLEKL